jgi:PAS domain S-box-containing protein
MDSFDENTTRQKRNKEENRLSEERYRSLVETQSELIARSDTSGKLTFVNDAYCRSFGKDRKELIGDTFFPTVFSEDLPATLAMLQEIQQFPYRKSIETRHLTPQGLRWINWENTAILDESGIIIEFQGVGRDVTERKLTEEALHLSEEKYRRIVETAKEGILIFDTNWRISFTNARGAELFEYHPDEFLGMHIDEFVFDEDLPGHQKRKKVREQGIGDTREGVYRTKTGAKIWLLVSISPIMEKGKYAGTIIMATDITDRKKAEEAAIRQLALTETMARVANRLNAQLDLEKVLQVVCEEAVDALNVPGACVFLADEGQKKLRLADLFIKGVPGVPRDYIKAAIPISLDLYFESIQKMGTAFVIPEIQIETSLQNQVLYKQLDIHTIAIASMIRDEKVIGALVAVTTGRGRNFEEGELLLLKVLADESVQAITNARLLHNARIELIERSEAENGLQKAKEFAENLIATANVIVIQLDLAGNIQVFNQAAEKITGYSRDEVMNRNWDILVPRDLYPKTWDDFSRLSSGGLPKNNENPIRTKSGNERYIAWQNNELYDNGLIVGIISFGMDITERIQAEKDLRTSEAQYRLLAENMSDTIWLMDTDLQILYASPSGLRQRGYSSIEEMNAVPPEQHLTSDSLSQVMQFYQQAFSTENLSRPDPQLSISIELEFYRKDRSTFWSDNSFTFILDNQGYPVRILGVGRDITERKRVESQIQRHLVELETIYENGLALAQLSEPKEIGSKIIDVLRKRLHWHHAVIRSYNAQNQSMYILALCSQEQDVEKNFQEIQRLNQLVSSPEKGLSGWAIQNRKSLVCNDLSKEPRYIATYSEMCSGIYAPIITGDTTIGCISIESDQPGAFDEHDLRLLETVAAQAAIALENARLYQAAQADLVERKRIEAELQALNEQLEQRVAERSKELRIAYQELERASRSKDEFLASMSHELRTPLSGILNLSEALQEKVYGPLNEKQSQVLHTIEQSGQHLLGLINDILDLSKIEAGQLELQIEACSAVDVCNACLQMIKGLAQKRRQNVSFKSSTMNLELLADPRRLKQMLMNLLSNAVKFTPEGGLIGLQLDEDAQNQNVLFTVWDNGIGIAAEDLLKLFRPFTQLDSRLSRQQSGTGLGLALVKRMAEMHGGTVSVQSTPGQGSRFVITLPWNSPPPQDAEHQRRYIAGSVNSKANLELHVVGPDKMGPLILLADDNDINLSTYSDYLIVKGYRVIVAKNGNEAIKAAQTSKPDLILMDIQMPGKDGLEAIREIRASAGEKAATIPIIALTALAMPGDRELCIAAGANDYISKPIAMQKLVLAIEDNLRKGNNTK